MTEKEQPEEKQLKSDMGRRMAQSDVIRKDRAASRNKYLLPIIAHSGAMGYMTPDSRSLAKASWRDHNGSCLAP